MEKERQAKIYPKQAQVAIEYVIIFAVILAAIVTVNFIGGMSGVCENFFNKAVDAMR